MSFDRMVLGVAAAACLALAAHAQDAPDQEAPKQEAAAGGASDDLAALMASGEELFLVNCRQCHGTKGTAGQPLAENASLEDGAFVAHTIVMGRGYMTAFGEHLSDDEIAAIATFVRNSWGNAFGPVDAAIVADAR